MGSWSLKYLFVFRDIQVLPVALQHLRSSGSNLTPYVRSGRGAIILQFCFTPHLPAGEKKEPQYDMKPPLSVPVSM